MTDKKQDKPKVSKKKRKGSESSDLSEIEWSDNEFFTKKGSLRQNPTNQGKQDASSNPNSKAEEDFYSKKAVSSPAK